MMLTLKVLTSLFVAMLTAMNAAAQTTAPAYIDFPFVQETGSSYRVSRSQLLFHSTVIEHLRQYEVHVQNHGKRTIRPNAEFAGEQLVMNTRTHGSKSFAGLEIRVIAWPTTQQAAVYTKAFQEKNPVNLVLSKTKNIVQSGLFTTEFKPVTVDNSSMVLTQLAAEFAMSNYAPRSFTESADEAIWKWNFVNTESNNQGSQLRAYLRDFPNSPHRQAAELALISLPRNRGAVLVSPSAECTTRLHGAMRYLGGLARDTVLPNDLFINADTFELGAKGRSTVDTPPYERAAWDLSLDSNNPNDASQAKDKCALRERWGNDRNILAPCVCAPLVIK